MLPFKALYFPSFRIYFLHYAYTFLEGLYWRRHNTHQAICQYNPKKDLGFYTISQLLLLLLWLCFPIGKNIIEYSSLTSVLLVNIVYEKCTLYSCR